MRVHGSVRSNIGFGARIFACVLIASIAQVDAVAQRGGGGGGGRGPQLAPEKLDAAWSAQSNGVAHENGISGDNVGKLAAAYKESRTSQGKAMEELMATAERGPGMFQDILALNESEAGTLKTALSGFLSEKEVADVMPALGSYNRQWDRFTDTLLGFELDEADQFKASALIANYVIESDKARAEAMAAMDFEGMRSATQELKSKLDADLGGILSAEQIATWNEATQQRPRGQGGQGGGRQGN